MTRAGLCEHFGFGNSGAFEAFDTCGLLQRDNLREFVRFYMRPKALCVSGYTYCFLDIFNNDIRVVQQGRGVNFRRVGELI